MFAAAVQAIQIKISWDFIKVAELDADLDV